MPKILLYKSDTFLHPQVRQFINLHFYTEDQEDEMVEISKKRKNAQFSFSVVEILLEHPIHQ